MKYKINNTVTSSGKFKKHTVVQRRPFTPVNFSDEEFCSKSVRKLFIIDFRGCLTTPLKLESTYIDKKKGNLFSLPVSYF